MAMVHVLTGVSVFSGEKLRLISNAATVSASAYIPVAHIRSVLTAVKEGREKSYPDIYTWKINGFQWLTIGPLTVTNDPMERINEGFDYLISLMEKVVAD